VVSNKKGLIYAVILVVMASGVAAFGAANVKLIDINKAQVQEIEELKSYRDKFPGEFAFAAHNPETGWQVRLRCVNHMEPNTTYTIDLALVVWDKDFAGYRCNVIEEDPTGTTE
tara:strand:+ start:176 stop:517 length:342 start_codon:yes stop_codon:yes gene_type:complete